MKEYGTTAKHTKTCRFGTQELGMNICRRFYVCISEQSATSHRAILKSETQFKHKRLPVVTKLCGLGKLIVSHSTKAEKERWTEPELHQPTQQECYKVHKTLHTEPETISS